MILYKTGTTYNVTDWGGNFNDIPTLDQQQDVLGTFMSEHTGNFVSFTRPLNTGDSNDRGIVGCHYVAIATGLILNGAVSFPAANIFQYPQQVCITACGEHILGKLGSISLRKHAFVIYVDF